MTAAQIVVRSGLKLAVHDSGGDGVPFVLQHGLCGSAAQTAEVMPHAAGVRRLTLECRGHGASDAGDPSQFSIATFHDDLAWLIQEHLDAPAIIGGISMGAAIATRFAVTHPKSVRALIIARPAWVTRAAPDNMRPYLEAGKLLARHPADRARHLFGASPTALRLAAQAPDNLASLDGFFSRVPQAVTAELLMRIAVDGPGVSAADLGRVAFPVLIIGHRRELAHPFAACQELAALLPRARLVEITPKAADKAAYLSDFQAALAAFLKDILDGPT